MSRGERKCTTGPVKKKRKNVSGHPFQDRAEVDKTTVVDKRKQKGALNTNNVGKARPGLKGKEKLGTSGRGTYRAMERPSAWKNTRAEGDTRG